MKKLIQGIVDFRKNHLENYRDTFARLALGQSPDALFIACSDSRVVPNLFASTNPGDLFVLRNVGNLMPPCTHDGLSTGDESEAAAIEFAVLNLNVSSIVVCGHSECGAVQAAYKGRNNVVPPNLKSWLRLIDPALEKLKTIQQDAQDLKPHNLLSQLNVLTQLDHIRTYPSVQEKLKKGELALYGWWFDIARAEVYSYEEELEKFIVIDETEAARLLKKLENTHPR